MENIQKLSTEAYDFAKRLLSESVEDGRYDISDTVWANVFTHTTKPLSDAKYEAHRQYIDVQLIIDGHEKICTQSLETMKMGKCLQEYTDDSDVELYESNNKGKEHILKAGDYLILYPEDAHMPGVCVDTPSIVKKAVIKIKVQ